MKPALLCIALVACAASTRSKALTDTKTAIDAAAVAYDAYDKAHQLQIVAAAADKARGQTALTQYRAEQSKVEQLFVVAYQAIATALTVNTDPSAATAATAPTMSTHRAPFSLARAETLLHRSSQP